MEDDASPVIKTSFSLWGGGTKKTNSFPKPSRFHIPSTNDVKSKRKQMSHERSYMWKL